MVANALRRLADATRAADRRHASPNINQPRHTRNRRHARVGAAAIDSDVPLALQLRIFVARMLRAIPSDVCCFISVADIRAISAVSLMAQNFFAQCLKFNLFSHNNTTSAENGSSINGSGIGSGGSR